MSQVNINRPLQDIQNQPVPGPAPEGLAKPNLPQELQNARPSSSGWATFGRVVLGVVRVIGAIATLCISEVIIRTAIAARDAPEPRVQPHNPDHLPPADPQVEAGKKVLSDGMLKLNLPPRHIEALQGLLTDLADRYGDNVPKNLDDLRKLKLHSGEPFILKLRDAVKQSAEDVTPARLQDMARDFLEPEMVKRSLDVALQNKARELGIQLESWGPNHEPRGLQLATNKFLQACEERGSMPMSQLKDSVEPFLNPRGLNTEQSVQTAFQSVQDYPFVEDALRRAALQDGQEHDTLPPEHAAALDNMVAKLRTAYGQDCLPQEPKKILRTRPTHGNTVLDGLKELAQNAETAISPQDFGRLLKEQLTPMCQRHALGLALGERLEKEHGIKLHPQVLGHLLDELENRCPALTKNLDRISNVQAARETLEAQKTATDDFLAFVGNNVKYLEQTYLPQVQPQLQPILRNLIRSLPTGPAHMEESQAQVARLAADMSTWQASIPLGDPSLNDFCTHLADDLNNRTSTLAAEEGSKFKDNIYGTFDHDSNRNNWKLNGKEFNKKPADVLSGELKQIAPAPIDQQFLSKLTNQYLWSDLKVPMVAQAGPDNVVQPRVWNNSGEPVQEEARNNGLAFTTARQHVSVNGHFNQPQDVDLPNDGYFSITVSEDKKHAVVEMVVPSAMTTENPKQGLIPVGMCTHTLQVECELSGGDPNVRPRVTGIQLGQEIKPLNV
ncbi:MAG: hypothetical protein IJU37_08965 [Desulfovibrio sp.]|nr:hypothetical protein [Desulfovibrio sp.]